jgi:hypothetical protein
LFSQSLGRPKSHPLLKKKEISIVGVAHAVEHLPSPGQVQTPVLPNKSCF